MAAGSNKGGPGCAVVKDERHNSKSPARVRYSQQICSNFQKYMWKLVASPQEQLSIDKEKRSQFIDNGQERNVGGFARWFRGNRRHFLVRAWSMSGSELADSDGDEEAQQFFDPWLGQARSRSMVVSGWPDSQGQCLVLLRTYMQSGERLVMH